MKPNVMTYKGYTAKIEYVDEDRELFGEVIDLSDTIVFSGASVDELESSFHSAVDDYLAYCEERGIEPAKPYSGRVQLRLPPSLHRDACVAAASRGESLNAFFVEAISKAVGDSAETAGRLVSRS